LSERESAMSRKLLIATRNAKKKRELQDIMRDWDIEVLTLDDFPGLPEVEEDGATFEANAVKKARIVAAASGQVTLADDSGLEVDALEGAPGIYSARFAGLNADDAANNRKLMYLLERIPADRRAARFVCVIAVALPDGQVHTVTGKCEGRIAENSQGEGGFGYDPLFIPQGFSRTFAQLDPAEKHQISHRGQALNKARKLLQAVFGEGDAI